MSNCKFKFHSPRGSTWGNDSIHYPDGCAVLKTDKDDHDAGTCGGRDLCYFCVLGNNHVKFQ